MRSPARAAGAFILAALLSGPAAARDDGRYAASPLKPWFDSLRSERWGPAAPMPTARH